MQAGIQEVPLKYETKLFMVRVTPLPKGVMESLSLETFKTPLHAFLCELIYMLLLQQGDWTR